MAAGFKLSGRSVEKFKRLVKAYEDNPPVKNVNPNPSRSHIPGFLAMLVGCDITGLRWNYIRVNPVPLNVADFILGRDRGIGYEIASSDREEGYCVELNGHKDIENFTLVQAYHVGYAPDTGEPVFSFSFTNPPEQPAFVAPHDHRDAYNGGFAFAIYHPGTSLPQMPWAH